ncbi:MAG: hypothetical protein KatS3mg019_0115 [Fimbriimonadales bacterium]|nr:MAG: hypothetical protein KatS3mg019_0115 [Fimbriimonadales bacterium]
MRNESGYRWRLPKRARILALMCSLALPHVLQAQSLTWLGTLGGAYSEARGVSNDGVVVGVAARTDSQRAFRWQNGVMQDLGTLGGLNSVATGVSADGAVVVGYAFNLQGQPRAFRWENSVMRELDPLGSPYSIAYGVSADGNAAVGVAPGELGRPRAFRWRGAYPLELEAFNGQDSAAYGTSYSGNVIVGSSGGRAFRWKNLDLEDLGGLGNSQFAEARAVSADGEIVVGAVFFSDDETEYSRAFRSQFGFMQDLGTLGGASSYAHGISGDGAIIVGDAENSAGEPRAFRWTETNGMQDLNQVYAALLSGDSRLFRALAISQNGRYIAGVGYNAATGRTEAFLLDTVCNLLERGDANSDGIVDDADLLTVLFNFGTRCESSGHTLTWLGVLPNGSGSEASAVSDTGVVVGNAAVGIGIRRAFRWQNGMMRELYPQRGGRSFALGISADGNRIAGYVEPRIDAEFYAFRWASDGLEELDLPYYHFANAVSANGRVIVGTYQDNRNRGFRWQGDDIEFLQGLISAYGVSADGSVVVGHTSVNFRAQAARWTRVSGVVPLGTLGGAISIAYGVSGNGEVVVGEAQSADGNFRAFRWQNGAIQDLGGLGGRLNTFVSRAKGVSGDGTVVVGLAYNAENQPSAFCWRQTTGMQDLNQVYQALLQDGSRLQAATAISHSGRYLAGVGFNAATGRNEAFLIDTFCNLPGDVNRDGLVDDADLLIVLFNFGGRCY